MTEDNPIVPWIHINSVPEAVVRAVLPAAEVIVEGDCGSVWGEKHDPALPCPHPHVLVKDGRVGDLLALKSLKISHVATGEDWSDELHSYLWIEDDRCPYRTDYLDYRKPYVRGGVS